MTLDPALATQSRGRELTALERALADALEAVFATGTHEFDAVAQELGARGIARPSGAAEPWSRAALEAELKAINQSLDAAYLAHGRGAQ